MHAGALRRCRAYLFVSRRQVINSASGDPAAAAVPWSRVDHAVVPRRVIGEPVHGCTGTSCHQLIARPHV